MRHIGLDVHRDFCEVAIAEEGKVRSAGRIRTTVEELELFAQSLGSDDEVGLETTGNALTIARLLEPFVARVVVADTRNLRVITHAKAKSDPVDARMLARLLASDMLPEVWRCDEQTRVLRRRVSRRTQLVRQRTRAKNQVHAALIRNVKGKPPNDRRLRTQGPGMACRARAPRGRAPHRRRLPARDRLRLRRDRHARSGPRPARGLHAGHPPAHDDSRHLAADRRDAHGGDRRRPSLPEPASPRRLSRPRPAGAPVRANRRPATGHISKQGDAAARHVLVEAAHSVERAPGPLRAFKRRVQARRGFQIAMVAVARKLATIAWHLLTKQEDYAYARPALTHRKLRQAELAAGAPKRSNPRGSRGPATPDRPAQWHREREVAEQAERAYERLVKDRASVGRRSEG